MYEAASEEEKREGAEWYGKANKVAYKIGHEVDPYCNGLVPDAIDKIRCGAGILAALSPRMPWPRNVELGMAVSEGKDIKALGMSIRKVKRIVDGEDPGEVVKGPKEFAFFLNIAYAGQCDAVTIDTHALAIYMGRKVNSKMYGRLSRKGEYARIERAYQRAAKEVGVPVSTMQATTWVAWRNK